MKRLSYIYSASLLTVALNTLPGMLEGTSRIVAASVLAIGLWAVTWLRVYTNKKLRPEFAILSILPALSFHIFSGAGREYLALFASPGWQNFNFFLWLASAWVIIRALLPTPEEYRGRMAKDSVFIFMTIITIVYTTSCWMATHSIFLTL